MSPTLRRRGASRGSCKSGSRCRKRRKLTTSNSFEDVAAELAPSTLEGRPLSEPREKLWRTSSTRETDNLRRNGDDAILNGSVRLPQRSSSNIVAISDSESTDDFTMIDTDIALQSSSDDDTGHIPFGTSHPIRSFEKIMNELGSPESRWIEYTPPLPNPDVRLSRDRRTLQTYQVNNPLLGSRSSYIKSRKSNPLRAVPRKRPCPLRPSSLWS